jgi:hypothetical protein
MQVDQDQANSGERDQNYDCNLVPRHNYFPFSSLFAVQVNSSNDNRGLPEGWGTVAKDCGIEIDRTSGMNPIGFMGKILCANNGAIDKFNSIRLGIVFTRGLTEFLQPDIGLVYRARNACCMKSRLWIMRQDKVTPASGWKIHCGNGNYDAAPYGGPSPCLTPALLSHLSILHKSCLYQ